MELGTIYWYSCPECGFTWASDSRVVTSEWCMSCFSALEPEFIYEEEIQL